MSDVDPADRGSVETAYPVSAYEEDIARNAAGDAEVRHGVRIERADGGRFRLIRAGRHAGEAAAGDASLFLAPEGQHRYASLAKSDTRYGGPVEAGNELDAARRRADGYAAFIDRLHEVMRASPFPEPIGRDEERLKGFHGG